MDPEDSERALPGPPGRLDDEELEGAEEVDVDVDADVDDVVGEEMDEEGE